MPREKLHPKIKKNLYDLSYNRYLNKSHAFINLGLGIWLAFIAILATYMIDGKHEFSKGIIIFTSAITATIFFTSLGFYLQSKKKRNNIELKIKRLNSEAKEL